MTNFDSTFGPKKPKVPKSYSPRAVAKQIKQYKKNTKVVKQHGIQSTDQRSSVDYTTRVYKGQNKPMSVTLGSSTKAGKGTTVYKKGKK